MSLKKYIEEKNFWRNPKLVYGKLTTKQIIDLKECIECDLSPENLCCDGELPAYQVKARYKMLTAALAELEAL